MRQEPCLCGGVIVASNDSAYAIRGAVTAHNRSFEHRSVLEKWWPHLCETCHAVGTINRECHGCAGRFSGPLTVDYLVANGLAGRV